jgi:hypothetical protein
MEAFPCHEGGIPTDREVIMLYLSLGAKSVRGRTLAEFGVIERLCVAHYGGEYGAPIVQVGLTPAWSTKHGLSWSGRLPLHQFTSKGFLGPWLVARKQRATPRSGAFALKAFRLVARYRLEPSTKGL